MTPTKPCNDLREPFFSRGYCLNCHVLAVLHTPDGWRTYYGDMARSCAAEAQKARVRATELEEAAAEAWLIAERFSVRAEGE